MLVLFFKAIFVKIRQYKILHHYENLVNVIFFNLISYKNILLRLGQLHVRSIRLTLFHLSIGAFIQFPLGDFLHTITEIIVRLQFKHF